MSRSGAKVLKTRFVVNGPQVFSWLLPCVTSDVAVLLLLFVIVLIVIVIIVSITTTNHRYYRREIAPIP